MRWAEVGSGFVSEISISETEEYGADWLNTMVGGLWVFVPDEAAVAPGYSYDEQGRFIPPKPGSTDEVADWVLNEETFTWEPVEA